jgi:hypothetical protein
VKAISNAKSDSDARSGDSETDKVLRECAFRFAESGSLARILAEAGAVEITERVLQFNISAPISVDQFWEMRSETSGTLRDKLATLSPSQMDQLAKEAEQSVSEFFSNSGMSIPAQMIIVTAHKPQWL